MGYFPNSISGRNKRGAASGPNAGCCSQPTRSYRLQHNWPQLVVLAAGIHCWLGLFGHAGEASADMSSPLSSLHNVEGRPRRRRSCKDNNNIIIPLASDNTQINLPADHRGAAIIHTLSSASAQCYFLLPSLATSFLQLPSVTPSLLFLCFTHARTHERTQPRRHCMLRLPV